MLILHTLWFIATVAFVYYLPGRMLYALLPDSKLPEESFAASLGLGLLAVNVPAIAVLGLVGLYFPLFMRWYIVLAVSLCATGIIGYLLWKKGRLKRRTLIARPLRGQLALAGIRFHVLDRPGLPQRDDYLPGRNVDRRHVTASSPDPTPTFRLPTAHFSRVASLLG